MNETNDRASQSGNSAVADRGLGSPKKGERYRCGTCGMEVQVTEDCHCESADMVHFHCCGKEMQKA